MTARLLKDPATANCRIFIGHLHANETNKIELEQRFSKYGTVIGSLINHGFGFVQFENEMSAQAAIKSEHGQMFKGRRIDVRPAKKDTHNSSNNSGNQYHDDRSKNQGGNQFTNKNNSTPPKNQNQFDNSNLNKENINDSSFDEPKNADDKGNNDFQASPSKSDNNFNPNLKNDAAKKDNKSNAGPSSIEIDLTDDNDAGNNSNNNFNNNNNNVDSNDDNNNVNNDNNNPNNVNNSNNNNNNSQNNSGNNPSHNSGNQNRNQNRNDHQGNSQPRQRGNRGGKNRNKNRGGGGGNNGDNPMNGGNFRDRSPLNRQQMRGRGNNDDKNRDWDHNPMMQNSNYNRDAFNDNNRFDDRYKDNMGGRNYPRALPDFVPMPVAEKNDCEIIVVNKSLTEYAEAIEARLKKMCLTVDLLFPNEEVALSRVLGNIANRGCLYAVVITPQNMEHRSMTLNILHGLPQEHRNMPVEDALNLISRDFSNYKSGGRNIPFNTPFASDRHPDAIQVLLNTLADNHVLTVIQYDRLIKYLEVKREEQMQVELGDAKDLGGAPGLGVSHPKQAELQSRILNILNSNKNANANVNVPSPVPAPAPVPAPPTTWATGSSMNTVTDVPSNTGVSPSPLLNDPTVQKALDSLLQGNLLKNIGDSQSRSAPQPLFAAFPNINRF